MHQPPGSVSIQFVAGPEQGQILSLSKPCIAIGREPAHNDVIANDPSVSRDHAQLIWNQGTWSIKNITSSNTVTVNQMEVQGQQQAMIKDQDTIGLGQNTTFLFLINTPSPQYQQQMGSPSPLKTERISNLGLPLPNIPTLEITTNTSQKKQVYSLTKQEISIGRDPSNDIVIDELVISGMHIQIRHENNQLILIHPHPLQPQQKTTNGLLYKGRHIQGTEKFHQALTRGDVFRIGNEYGTLVTLTYNDGSGRSQDSVPVIKPISLGAPQITLGRLPENTVVLNHPQVSARHARLVQDHGTYRVIDMGSTNHVYVNAQRITNQLLKPGDEIRIGPFKLTYTGTQLTQQDENMNIRIDALGLKKAGNKEVILLDDISLAIPPRKFVALVGGSGAGKSTLMDALNGLRPAQQGQVFYNGQDYYKSFAAFSTQLGYVPQDDIVHRDLTVERALYYAAKLRLPDDFTEAQIKQRIDEVLEDVELKYRRKLLVSKLSGGQRKRISIALELLAKPSVFFLDEPTSGLDPGLDRKMMLLLRKLADKGHTIVLVTHATNNISVCDYVCFLCQGGRLAYFGPPDEATAFFGQSDFADIYSALEQTETDPDIPEKAEAKFRNSQEYQKYVEGLLSQKPAPPTALLQHMGSTTLKRGNPWKQFFLLSQRYIELLKNDMGNLLILLLQAPIVGVILLLIIKYLLGTDTFDNAMPIGNAEKTLFIMAFAAVLFGCSNAAREIVKEVAIYRRERTVNLGIVPYMLSKFIVLGVLCMLQCAVLVVMVNAISPFRGGIDGFFVPVTVAIYITMVLTSWAALMLGLAVSALAPNSDRATSLIPIILLPQVIFSGVLFKLDGPVAEFFGGFFAARWAISGMGSTINLCGQLSCGPLLGSDDFSFQHNAGHVFLSWFMLVLMIIVVGAATAYFLKRKDVRR